MKNEALFRDKPVWSAIFSLAIPSCITILIMTIYNMADMFFIGMLGDTAQVAAVSVVGPMFSLVMAAVLFGIFCTIVILSATDPILKMLGANEEIMAPARAYMRTLAVGAPFMLFSTAFASILRAEGAIKEGLIGNMAGTVLNIILDPLFILVLHQGVVGAAVATVIGNVVSSGFYLYYIFKRLMGFTGIAAAHTIADVLSTIIAVATCLWQYRIMKKKILAMNSKL